MTNELPLADVKIANFAWAGVGPTSVRYLASWGATAVRVESHRRVDVMRRSQPFENDIPKVDNSVWFSQANGAVYSLSIDLRKSTGLNIAKKLIRWADVMVESFTPGTMQKLGLDYNSVIKYKPDIIYLSTCQMGQTGPLAKFAGYGYHASAMAGLAHLTGWPDRGPTPHAVAFVDPLAARFSAIEILAALEHHRHTGEGQYIDLSQCEAALLHISPALMDYFVNGRSMIRCGNSLHNAAPHGVYRCTGDDRWCAITIFDNEQWESFSWIVNQEWTKDPKFSSLSLRKQNESELNAYINAWTINYTAEDIETRLQSAGVPSHVVSTIKDVYEDPQLKHRGYLRKLKHSVMKEHTYYTNGFQLSKVEGNWKAGPALGEHNEYVFKEILKLSDDEIGDALIEGGITTDADLTQ